MRGARSWFATLAQWVTGRLDEESLLILLAVIVGAISAAGTVAFYSAIDGAFVVLFRWLPTVPLSSRLLYRPLATAIAIGTAAAVWRRVGRGDDGLTVPDVQLAVVRRGGVLSFRRAMGRTLASAITIGGGGSAGSEGPVAVLGAALASRLSQALRLSEARSRVLVGAGVAAGISAAFNAPLAGAFFALEEILGAFRGDHFAPVVIASVTAAVLSRSVLGAHAGFALPEHFGYASAFEVLWAFPLLGLAAGLGAALFIDSHFAIADFLNRWKRSSLLRRMLPWVAGALVGVSVSASGGLLVGAGHLAIPIPQLAAATAWSLLAMMLAKMFITSLTLHAGGSGGVFTPSLFAGASLGSAVAVILHRLVPGFNSPAETYALVGMGAMVAATTGAPITAALLVFEITGDYAIVMPLMMCVTISQVIARRFTRDTLYSGWLRRRGEELQRDGDREPARSA